MGTDNSRYRITQSVEFGRIVSQAHISSFILTLKLSMQLGSFYAACKQRTHQAVTSMPAINKSSQMNMITEEKAALSAWSPSTEPFWRAGFIYGSSFCPFSAVPVYSNLPHENEEPLYGLLSVLPSPKWRKRNLAVSSLPRSHCESAVLLLLFVVVSPNTLAFSPRGNASLFPVFPWLQQARQEGRILLHRSWELLCLLPVLPC